MKIIEPVVEIEKVDYNKMMKNLERACRTCYRSEDKITEESYKTLLKNCINRGHESILEHEKITIRMTCDIGVYKDLTRHRHASFSIESTRYCNYGKDKFDNQIKFIEPVNIEKNRMPSGILSLHILVIFTFSSSLRFLFTSYAWFFVMFSLTNLLLDTSFCAVTFESA